MNSNKNLTKNLKNQYSSLTNNIKKKILEIKNLNEKVEKLQKELDYTNGFLKSVNGKLNNEDFVKGAPEQVVTNEKKKQSDALQKIEVLEKQISSIQNA